MTPEEPEKIVSDEEVQSPMADTQPQSPNPADIVPSEELQSPMADTRPQTPASDTTDQEIDQKVQSPMVDNQPRNPNPADIVPKKQAQSPMADDQPENPNPNPGSETTNEEVDEKLQSPIVDNQSQTPTPAFETTDEEIDKKVQSPMTADTQPQYPNPADIVPDDEKVQSPPADNPPQPQNSTPAPETRDEQMDETFDRGAAGVEIRLIKTAEQIIDQYVLRYPAKASLGPITLLITIPRNDGGPPVQRKFRDARVEHDNEGDSQQGEKGVYDMDKIRALETPTAEILLAFARDVFSNATPPGVLDWRKATFKVGDWAGLLPMGKARPLPIPPMSSSQGKEEFFSSHWTSYESLEDKVTTSHTKAKTKREWTPALAQDMEMYRNQKAIRMHRLQKLHRYIKWQGLQVASYGPRMRQIIDINSPALSSFWLDVPNSPARHKLSLAMKDFAKWLTKTRELHPHQNISSCEVCADYPVIVNGLKANPESGTTLGLLERQLDIIFSKGEDASRTVWRNIRSAVEVKAGMNQVTFDVSDDPHYLRGIVPDPDLKESNWHDWREVVSLILVLAEKTQKVKEALAWVDLSQMTAAQLESSSTSAKSFRKTFVEARQAAVSTKDIPAKTTVLAIQVIDIGYKKLAEQRKLDQEKPKPKKVKQHGRDVAEDYTDLTHGCVIAFGIDGFVHWQASGWENGYAFKKYAKEGGPMDGRKHSQEDVLLGAVQKLVASSGKQWSTDRNNAYLELFGININETCGQDKKGKPIMKSVELSLQLREIKKVTMFDIKKFTFGGESNEFREEDNDEDEDDDDGADFVAKTDAALLWAYNRPGKVI